MYMYQQCEGGFDASETAPTLTLHMWMLTCTCACVHFDAPRLVIINSCASQFHEGGYDKINDHTCLSIHVS